MADRSNQKLTTTPLVEAGATTKRFDVRGTLLPCALLLLAVAAVYWPVLRFEFVNYDDHSFVLENKDVQQGLNARSLGWALQSLYIYWQPLTWISYMLDHARVGLAPGGYHLTNMLLHGASTVLLFLAWRRMTGAVAASAVVAALFALHPLHVETVAWIAERKGALSGVFWMLALWAYARHAERPRPSAYALVLLFFALGLMSKSAVLTLPCVLLLLDFWPLRRFAIFQAQDRGVEGAPRFPKQNTVPLFLEKLPLLALAVASSVITVLAQKRMGAVFSAEAISWPQRLAQSVVGYAVYLRKMFWPDDLCVFYPNPLHWPAWQVAVSALVLVAVTVLALGTIKRRPYFLVGWLWFLGTLFPVIGLFQTGEQFMADRYTYLPLTGLFVILVWGAMDGFGKFQAGALLLRGGALAALLACAWLAARQVQTWRNTKTLFVQAHAVTKGNYLADTVLGRLLVEEGKFAEAVPFFQSALTVQPFYSSTHHGLGDALAAQGQFTNAIVHYVEALRTDPNNGKMRLRLASAYQGGGRSDEAAAEFNQVLQAYPDSPSAELGLATIRHNQQRYPEALAHYRRTLQLMSSQLVPLNNAAWILATHTDAAVRNGVEAVQFAERANVLSGSKVPFLLGTLAAAYAEQGNFPAAIRTAEQARDGALAAGQKELADRNTEFLELYRAGKPCRQDVP